MAAYFTGGGAGTDVVQAAGTDGLQTLYLMNPSYVGFTDAATAPGGASNVMFLNSTVSTLTPARFGHHHQQPTPAAQHFVGIPLQPAPHSGYNLWGPDTTGAATGNDVSPPRHGQQQAPAAGTSAAVAAVSPVLSLSSREAAPPVTVAAAAVPGGTEHEQQVVMRSRYLKAAQELLDEAVSVSKGATAVKKKEDSEGGVSGGGGGGGVDDGGDSKSGGAAAEMSTAERQELQMKKSKLLNMLDEVEQRYRQYHRQMQAVAAAFEAAAGAGSARTYTSLALRTISRQFRCLRDAIAAQVRAASRGLGEDCGDEDGSGGRTTVGSRLRFIDSQLRQQRAMQQLGMVHAAGGGGGGGWRPQRGLPERAVSVLRAWLFEHFLHPYPKDSDKVMLAKQTGLTRSQVSNWFINARVRLWKPMVEEMYAEETKAKEEEEHDAAATAVTGDGSNDSVAEQPPDKPESAGIGMSSSPAATTSRSAGVHAGVQQTQASFYGGGGVGGGDAFQCRIKKARTTADEPTAAFHVSDEAAVSHRELLMKFMEAGGEGARGHPGVIDDDDDDVAGGNGGYSLFTPAPYVHQFGSEHFAFAGHGGRGVSLTLGLPHGADQTPASFLMGASTGGSDGGAPVTTAGYDMNMQSTKSLAAQLMRDFVA